MGAVAPRRTVPCRRGSVAGQGPGLSRAKPESAGERLPDKVRLLCDALRGTDATWDRTLPPSRFPFARLTGVAFLMCSRSALGADAMSMLIPSDEPLRVTSTGLLRGGNRGSKNRGSDPGMSARAGDWCLLRSVLYGIEKPSARWQLSSMFFAAWMRGVMYSCGSDT